MPSRTADLTDDDQPTRMLESTPTKPKRTNGSPVRREERIRPRDAADLEGYQLGDCLGKGAFGSVYRALEWDTGKTVAVKRIKLTDLPRSELRVIMAEIDLLKHLKHPNIVKYERHVQSPETLNIILEFCENGSLHTILKDFGRFPENLVANYMSQALQGLFYLHEQGVIHRDIKGANILTTKDGTVKLADFGVASKTTGLHESSVVGTPYWMAPEVIELTGATTASDIWSLGCTVIELLNGKPPYHNLQPMPALFRIVNDDHPPLPQGASPIVIDFLMQCFQKDPNLRVSAKKLLRHPWILSASRTDADEPKKATKHDTAVKSVQEWNEAVKDSPNGTLARKNSRTSSSSPIPGVKDIYRSTKAPNKRTGQTGNQESSDTFRSVQEDSGEDWEKDFESAPSPSALQQLPHLRPHDNFGGLLSSEKLKSYASVENVMGQENQLSSDGNDTVRMATQRSEPDAFRTVRPAPTPVKRAERGHARHKSEMPKPKSKPLQAPRKASLPSSRQSVNAVRGKVPESKAFSHAHTPEQARQIFRESSIEDFSDIIEGNELAIDTKFGMIKMRNEAPSQILDSPSVTDLMQSMKSPQIGGSLRKQQPKDRISMRRTRSLIEIQRFAENEHDEDFSDLPIPDQQLWTKPDIHDGSPADTLMISSRSWPADEDEEDDPFAQLEEGLLEPDLETNVARDKQARLREEVVALLGRLKETQDESELLQVSEDLVNIFGVFTETKSVIVSDHGVLPILEILEDCIAVDVILNLLKIINAIIYKDVDLQENICFVGGIPKILKFASKKYSRDIRLQAAAFVRQMYQTSKLILQMFVSAGGLNVLVDFLEDDYDDDRELVLIGVNGIWSVFELQGSTPKNDFCRILTRNSVLDPLSLILVRVLNEPAKSGEQHELAELCEARIASIFFIFSQAENYVKEAVAERSVLHRLLKNLRKMSPASQITMLKFIKNLSMLGTTIDTLHNSNAIDVLTELLSSSINKPNFREVSNQIVGIIFHLCMLSRRRQEDAALCGIIPIFIQICKDESPVKGFALPVLCDMVHSGRAARRELWQNKGLAFYISLLADQYWQATALESIFTWLQEETSRVEDQLLDNQNFHSALVWALSKSSSLSFEKLLEPLQKLLRISIPISCSLTESPELFSIIKERLNHNKPEIRIALLRILDCLCDATESGSILLDQHGLLDAVRELSRRDSKVLVRSLAQELIKFSQEMDAASIHSNAGSTTSQPRNARKPTMMRRQSSNTTPPHLLERQVMPTSPQLSRASLSYLDAQDRVAQTPRRQRNGVGYINGSSAMRPASRDGHSYIREGSPVVTAPSLVRAHTATTASDMTVNRSRLPRQSVPGRLSRQSTRESLSSAGSKDSTSNTPLTLTPVPETRRKENTQINSPQISSRTRNVEIHAGTGARRTTAVRRQNTGSSTLDRDQWA